jgi:hypothetical protein
MQARIWDGNQWVMADSNVWTENLEWETVPVWQWTGTAWE